MEASSRLGLNSWLSRVARPRRCAKTSACGTRSRAHPNPNSYPNPYPNPNPDPNPIPNLNPDPNPNPDPDPDPDPSPNPNPNPLDKASEGQSDFLLEAFKWSAYLLPEPLRLVRLSSSELRKVTQADYETGIEQRFTEVEEGDHLETLASNLLRMVSKTVRLERLSIDADLWQPPEDADPPEECYMVT